MKSLVRTIKKQSDLIILSIIWLISIYSVISAFANSYNLWIQNYVGYGLLIIISILRFLKIKHFKTVLGIFIILGSTNLIQFTYQQIGLRSGVSIIGNKIFLPSIQPLSVMLLVLLIILNITDFVKLKDYLFAEDPQIIADRKKYEEQKYYDLLKVEDIDILKEILDNRRKNPIERVRVAQKLIDERNIE